MVDSFAIRLEARGPGIARQYALRLDRDLFGAWVVELQHGRIGTRGRVRLLAFEDEAAARAEIRRRLRRRDSAPKRIGAAYRAVLLQGASWLRAVRHE